jgi:hypothetical protein
MSADPFQVEVMATPTPTAGVGHLHNLRDDVDGDIDMWSLFENMHHLNPKAVG